MAGLDEVMERLVNEPEFASLIASDSASALSGYELTDQKLELVTTALEERRGPSTAEQRTSKAGLAGMLSLGEGLVDEPPSTQTDQPSRPFSGFTSRVSHGEQEAPHALDAVMAEWSRTDSDEAEAGSLTDTNPSDGPEAATKDGTIVIRGKDITIAGRSSDPGG